MRSNRKGLRVFDVDWIQNNGYRNGYHGLPRNVPIWIQTKDGGDPHLETMWRTSFEMGREDGIADRMQERGLPNG